jgi:hypothetical protein
LELGRPFWVENIPAKQLHISAVDPGFHDGFSMFNFVAFQIHSNAMGALFCERLKVSAFAATQFQYFQVGNLRFSTGLVVHDERKRTFSRIVHQ